MRLSINNRIFIQPLKHKHIFLLSSISYCFCLFILNRGLFTPLGLNSIGRIWHHYVGYQDIGFTRRTLWGTFLNFTGFNSLFDNEYVNAIFIYSILLGILIYLISNFIYKRITKYNLLDFIFIIFSPAFLFHLSYATGSSDIVCIIVLVIAVLYIDTYDIKSNVLLGLLCSSGVLIHDLFIFFLPFVYTIDFLKNSKSQIRVFNAFKISKLLLILAFPTSLLLLAHLSSADAPDFNFYSELIKSKIPLAYNSGHDYWSGYFEIYSKLIDQNVFRRIIPTFLKYPFGFIIPLTYLFIILKSLIASINIKSTIVRFMIFLSILSPLLISFVGTEFVRWMSLSSIIGILYFIYLRGNSMINLSFNKIRLLLLFSLFSPFGIVPNNFIPLHSFILN